ATLTVFALVAAGLVCARHHANIRRLLEGKENRLRESPAMLTAMKTLHVLALGLWFGSMVLFTIVGLLLFNSLERLTAKEQRDYWLPIPAELAGEPPSPAFPDPLRKEQGSRLFGEAVRQMFPV